MATDIKFLTDEHIHLPVAKALRDKNIDALSLKDAGLLGAPDIEILEFARMNRRILVTRDKDFLALASKGYQHTGIMFLAKPLSIGDIIKELEYIEILYKPEDLANTVLYIPQKHG